ncbi:MAG: TM2 domain-containing protein [Oscillospiraceae bacterium]|nr:TM2 domain-containing protein [Oscillospiraceae bacterium]
MFCYKCGAEIDDAAVVCVKCGCATKNYNAKLSYQDEVSCKSRLVALLLCIFLGGLGVHRFYIGKIGTGIIWLCTAGCCGIGWIIDIILIACGKMRDKDNYQIVLWD